MDTADAIRIRFPNDDDLQAVYESQARVYGISVEPRDVKAWKRRVYLDDILIAEDITDPQQPFLVETSLTYRSQLTVPGGASPRAASLPMFTVAPTHERAGIWQQLSLDPWIGDFERLSVVVGETRPAWMRLAHE
mgnify:CR=1 FL=1